MEPATAFHDLREVSSRGVKEQSAYGLGVGQGSGFSPTPPVLCNALHWIRGRARPVSAGPAPHNCSEGQHIALPATMPASTGTDTGWNGMQAARAFEEAMPVEGRVEPRSCVDR